ncbi:hypothetical protein ElyMa_005247600 [Elysia marginata]|uniref:Uncharacterized protein n=1 Tax=Elysia marginata TaxID=1093978 RepID=A0AAV4K0U7_9GAST|nr:hypothetical protein ElyMa_005247600 [Elysia marginata]
MLLPDWLLSCEDKKEGDGVEVLASLALRPTLAAQPVQGLDPYRTTTRLPRGSPVPGLKHMKYIETYRTKRDRTVLSHRVPSSCDLLQNRWDTTVPVPHDFRL